jgi:hypothetical protein
VSQTRRLLKRDMCAFPAANRVVFAACGSKARRWQSLLPRATQRYKQVVTRAQRENQLQNRVSARVEPVSKNRSLILELRICSKRALLRYLGNSRI